MNTTTRVPKAIYRWERHGNVLAIVDLWSARLPTRTLTNDIESVLDNLRQEGHLRPGDRVIYRDTEQTWDEVAIDAECRFTEFRHLGADTAEAAIGKLTGDTMTTFMTRASLDLADQLKDDLDRLAATAEPLDKAGGAAVTLTRCLGEIERNPDIDTAMQREWVLKYASFLLTRFGGIEVCDNLELADETARTADYVEIARAAGYCVIELDQHPGVFVWAKAPGVLSESEYASEEDAWRGCVEENQLSQEC